LLSYLKFFGHKYHKLKIILFLNWKRKKFEPIYSTFYPKIVTKLLKIWIWDLGSGSIRRIQG
jgi:hypothetical protein